MNKKKKIFLVVREPTGPYKFLMKAAKIHSEKLVNEKLNLQVNKSHKIDFIGIFYLIKIIFKTNFFSKKKLFQLSMKNTT